VAHFLAWLDQSVVKPLVIALCVIMGQESNYGSLHRFFPEEDHPVVEIS
jgi:hypothetical protein